MRTAIQTQEKWALTAISNFHPGSQKSSTESSSKLNMRGPGETIRNSDSVFPVGRQMSCSKYISVGLSTALIWAGSFSPQLAQCRRVEPSATSRPPGRDTQASMGPRVRARGIGRRALEKATGQAAGHRSPRAGASPARRRPLFPDSDGRSLDQWSNCGRFGLDRDPARISDEELP
jgi:hypothetical protein